MTDKDSICPPLLNFNLTENVLSNMQHLELEISPFVRKFRSKLFKHRISFFENLPVAIR